MFLETRECTTLALRKALLRTIVLLSSFSSLCAQSTKTVENLGTVTASQAAKGLGFNVNPANEWEFQLAAAAGATMVRFQCGWVTTETQTAPPANTNESSKFVLQSDCQSGLVYARRYGLKPTVLAAYGSPYHAILQVALPTGAPSGSTTLKVSFVSGVGGETLNNVTFPRNTIISSSGRQISALHSYAGALITGMTITGPYTATLNLASATTSALPADPSVLYTINEYLHPPAASFSPSDPSNLAYAEYAKFLAQSIAAAGLQGEVEIWNEPPWADDPWDDRADFYDHPAATSNPQVLAPPFMPNFGFVAAIQAQVPPNGVTFVWGGTEKSGASSVFNWMEGDTGTPFTQPARVITSESLHPYGVSPEDSLWVQSCLQSTILTFPAGPKPFYPCNLNGLAGGNFSVSEQFSLVQASINRDWGIHREITETGFQGASGDDIHKARFIVRQFLGYQAAGVSPIEFYRLFDTGPYAYGFVTASSISGVYVQNTAYTAISGLLSDLKKISGAPKPSTSTLPQIAQYQGTYPLDTVTFVGAQPSASQSSYLMYLWQRSTSANWPTLASPAASFVEIAVPPNMAIGSVLNVDTRQAVPYSQTGQTLMLEVSDDPVEISFTPASVRSIAFGPMSTSVTAGGAVTLSCSATLMSGMSTPCASPIYNSSNDAVSAIRGNTASATGVGVTTLTVAASGLTSSVPLMVLPAVPTLTFAAIPTQLAGGPAIPVSASSMSTGAITYALVSGPATISRNLVTPTGVGTILIRATQAAQGYYAVGSAQTSIQIQPSKTNISIQLPAVVVSTQLALPNVSLQMTKVGANYPTGAVDIMVDSRRVATVTVIASARGSRGGIEIPPMSVGQHKITASYSGDSNFQPGVSAAQTVTVVPDEVSIAVVCDSLTLASGQPLSCRVKVSEGAKPVTGMASYSFTGTPSGYVSLNAAGLGSIVLSHPPAGNGRLGIGFAAQGAYPACPYTLSTLVVSK